jgi:hypothetical protein
MSVGSEGTGAVEFPTLNRSINTPSFDETYRVNLPNVQGQVSIGGLEVSVDAGYSTPRSSLT